MVKFQNKVATSNTLVRDAAAEYIKNHPDATNKEVIDALGCSPRTVAYARSYLELETVNANREKFTPTEFREPEPTPQIEEKTPVASKYEPMATEALMKMLDEGEDVDVDDEKVRAGMLKQLRLMSFDNTLHQSIRMSAMDLYNKLKETARGITIGPGIPLNRAAAKDRMALLFRATGPELVLEVFEEIFTKRKEKIADEERGTTPKNEDISPSPISTA